MCGIFAVYNYQGDVEAYRQRALYLSKKYVVAIGLDRSGCLQLFIGSDIVVPIGLVATPLETISSVTSVLLLLVLVSRIMMCHGNTILMDFDRIWCSAYCQ